MRRLFLVLLPLLLACDGARASVEVEEDHIRFFDATSHRVLIQLDLLGHDQLGGSVGWYCIRTTFPQDPAPVTSCFDDLSDGGRKVFTATSINDQNNSASIDVTIRNNDVDDGRTLIAPVR
jgi:hypothetical protein